jgi:hypothetical protein
VLFKAHDINTPLRHVSEDVSVAFDSYFSRFLDVEEPAFVPLHPVEAQDSSDTASSQPKTPRNEDSQNGDKIVELGSSKESSGWLQTYVSHLSGDIQEDDDVNITEKSPRPHQPSLVAHDLIDGDLNGRNSLPGEMDDFYPELFGQIASLGDFIGMGYEIPIFPGLEQLMDGQDIWSDVLNNDMP